jgi:hypothetical protein
MKFTMTLEELSRRIDRSRYFAAAVIFVVASAYILKFVGFTDSVISNSSDSWGQFGDYIGGMLNPVLAYLAFYWLTQSILLQKEELTATKSALQESAVAQTKQEINSRRISRINALSAILTSHNNDITSARNSIEFITGQLRHNSAVFIPDGSLTNVQGAMPHIALLNSSLNKSLTERSNIMEKISELLSQNDS